MKPLVSAIIPAYNEEKHIEKCLKTLKEQSYPNIEIIVIDDGSRDRTAMIAEQLADKVLKQDHQGPGSARNYGVHESNGEIILFVDADMFFDKDFVKELIRPIIDNDAKGSVNIHEYVGNVENPWSKCWNISHRLPIGMRTSGDNPSEKDLEYYENSRTYRAILKSEFLKAKGFDTDGDFNDDFLSNATFKPYMVSTAISYHNNPDSLKDVFLSAAWIGKGKAVSSRYVRNILIHLLPVSIIRSLYPMIRYRIPSYIIYRIVLDFGLIYGIIASHLFSNRSK